MIPDTLRLMPREMRMMSERIFSLSAMPRGFALTLTDLPMLSEYAGLGGFRLLRAERAALLAADPARLAIRGEDGARLTLDLGGQPAWAGLNTALDLAAELVARHGRAEIAVAGAVHAPELALAPLLAGRWALSVTHRPTPDGAVLDATPGERGDPALDRLNRAGLDLPAALWWEIYETARSALAPDTALSRRHAGVIIVNDDGTVIGRSDNDDDSDMGFLARGAREQA